MLFDMRIREDGEKIAELEGAPAEKVLEKITETMRRSSKHLAVFIYNSAKKDSDPDGL